jgi:Flp pilus assembly protein TadD
VCLLYGFFAFRELRAATSASRGDLFGLEKAARLQPQSAEYQNALGRMYTFNLQQPEALAHLRSATELNPHRSTYWIDIACADRMFGFSESGHNSLQHAIQADPMNPAVLWEAANVSLAEGDVKRAVSLLRTVAKYDGTRRARAVALALRAGGTNDFVFPRTDPTSPEKR